MANLVKPDGFLFEAKFLYNLAYLVKPDKLLKYNGGTGGVDISISKGRNWKEEKYGGSQANPEPSRTNSMSF